MTGAGGSVRRLTEPIKGWLQRFALALLVAAAIGLMILGKADTGFVERLRITLTDAAAPVMGVLSRPIVTMTAVIESARNLIDLRAENARLREENARLKQWYGVAMGLERQNQSLRGLLNFIPGPEPTYVSARVIADAGGAFVRTVVLNAGGRDGVRGGQAVVDGDGFIGRIVEVGRRSARVLLITDLNARIPVVVEATRTPAILAGDNSDRPTLTFVPANARIDAGQRIVTSGQGGMLPPGLPVGVVASVEDGLIEVRPFVDWHRLEYVRVLDFALPGVLPSTRVAGAVGPL